MAKFDLDGLGPWSKSSYAWRWNDPRHYVLPPEVLATIQTLPPEVAVRFYPRALELDARAQADPTRIIQTGTAEEGDVLQALRQLAVDPAEEVVVSWRDADAVVTTWHVFTQHWAAFCYPSSDDVTVWPAGEAWVLSYHHAERFCWRDRRDSEPRRPGSWS